MRVDLTPLLPLPMTGGSRTASPGIIDSDFLAGSVESSSLEALSTQLTVMLKAGGQSLLVGVPEDQAKPFAHPALSKRQLEILGLLAEGKTNTEIARAISRSPHTIKLHVSTILRQLNVKSRTQAAVLASAILKDARPVARKKTEVIGSIVGTKLIGNGL